MSGRCLDALVWPAAIFAALAVIAMAGEGVKGAGVHRRYGCFNEGEWVGSCDIDGKGNILHRAHWSFNCDPWSEGVWANSTNNSGVNFSHGNWTCPVKYRSPSGCGDFIDDPRNMMCNHPTSLDHSSGCYERVLIEVGEPLNPQKHVCVQHPIWYDNYNTVGAVTPPIVGRHREQWTKWGEYEYIPPQRWVHAMEHGSVIFLYHQCLDERSLCSLRTFIRKWQLKLERGEMDGGKFRFILTPSKNLQRNFAMVTWGQAYLSKCFNENEMDEFISSHYRQAWEDVDKDGKYDYLWVGLKNNTNCPLQVSAAQQWDPEKKAERRDIKAAGDTLATVSLATVSELKELRREQQTLRVALVAALGLSVCSLLAVLAMLSRVLLPQVRGERSTYAVNPYDEASDSDGTAQSI